MQTERWLFPDTRAELGRMDTCWNKFAHIRVKSFCLDCQSFVKKDNVFFSKWVTFSKHSITMCLIKLVFSYRVEGNRVHVRSGEGNRWQFGKWEKSLIKNEPKASLLTASRSWIHTWSAIQSEKDILTSTICCDLYLPGFPNPRKVIPWPAFFFFFLQKFQFSDRKFSKRQNFFN